MKRTFPFYAKEFAELLRFYLDRADISPGRFAPLIHQTEQSIYGYLAGRVRPPMEKIAIWAAVLKLNREERDGFIQAAYEAHTPPAIWKRLCELERIADLAKPAPGAEEAARIEAAHAATVASLVALLAEAEAIFFARSLSADEIHTRRPRLGASIRKAIEKHSRPGTTPAQGMTAEGQAPG